MTYGSISIELNKGLRVSATSSRPNHHQAAAMLLAKEGGPTDSKRKMPSLSGVQLRALNSKCGRGVRGRRKGLPGRAIHVLHSQD